LETEQKAGVRNGKPDFSLRNQCCRRGCTSRRNPPSPNSAALKTGPSATLCGCHSLTNDGAIKPIAPVSKPSISVIAKHIPKMRGSMRANDSSSKVVCSSAMRHPRKNQRKTFTGIVTPSPSSAFKGALSDSIIYKVSSAIQLGLEFGTNHLG
jgi:hypothetical protein